MKMTINPDRAFFFFSFSPSAAPRRVPEHAQRRDHEGKSHVTSLPKESNNGSWTLRHAMLMLQVTGVAASYPAEMPGGGVWAVGGRARAVPPVGFWVRPCRKRGGCQQTRMVGSMSSGLSQAIGIYDLGTGWAEGWTVAIMVPVDAPEGRVPVAGLLVLVAVVPLLGSGI